MWAAEGQVGRVHGMVVGMSACTCASAAKVAQRDRVQVWCCWLLTKADKCDWIRLCEHWVLDSHAGLAG